MNVPAGRLRLVGRRSTSRAPGQGRGPTSVRVYNPLPLALRHYEDALLDVLASSGIDARSVDAPSIEVSGASPVQRVRAAVAELAERSRTARGGGHLLVCWPTYGLLDPALWMSGWGRTTVSVIVHDPTPLRRQLLMGPVAAKVGGWATRARHLRVVAHSDLAAEALGALGWPAPALLPHPLLESRGGSHRESRTSRTVLVCGQYKPARDLGLLRLLGPVLRERGYHPVIAGRGWPEVPGWEIVEGFLPESELDRRISASAAVLIPYSRFYQSGIAVRAVEFGVPVVGPDHPFLADLLGGRWPGLVPTDDPLNWADAVGAVAADRELVLTAGHLSRVRCEQLWSSYLDEAALDLV